MKYLFFALLAPLCFAIVNIIDSHLLNNVPMQNDTKRSGALTIFSGLFGIIVAIIIFAIVREHIFIDGHAILVLIGCGLLQTIFTYLYLKALEDREATGVIPILQFIPVFVYLFGLLFLGEKLSGTFLFAGALIVVGAILLSIDFKEGITFHKRSTFYIVLASLVAALWAVFFKMTAINEPSFGVSFFWTNIGFAIGAILFCIWKPFWTSFKSLLQKNGRHVFGFSIVNESLNTIGNAITFSVSLLIPVSIAFLINSLQPILLIGVGTIFAKKFPEFTLERTSGSGFYIKIVAVLIMLAGSVLLAKFAPAL